MYITGVSIENNSELKSIRETFFKKYNSEDSEKINGVIYPKQDPTFILKEPLLKVFGHLLQRSAAGFNPENVLLKGPQGCGKTETSLQFAALSGLPVLKINCSLIREPRDWFGYKTVEDSNVKWVRSEFAKLIERGGAVVLLDEISRATPPVLNSLLPLLDATGYSFLEEVKQIIKRGPDIFFFATANIGSQFTGTYGNLDKALDDRFAIRVETNYLEPEKEVELLVNRTGISSAVAKKLVKVATAVRVNSNGTFGGTLSATISTRNLLDAAVLYNSMGLSALEYTIIPLFNNKGGTSSQQAEVKQIIQSQFASKGA